MIRSLPALPPHWHDVGTPGGVRARFTASATLHWLECADLAINLFPGNELEGGPANLVLRRRDRPGQVHALLGPGGHREVRATADRLTVRGVWEALDYQVDFVIAPEIAGWFWTVSIASRDPDGVEVDVVHVLDVGLAPRAAIRTNEYYTSQYIDHQPLEHPVCGKVIASRQNLAMAGRHPWLLNGCCEGAVSFATDGRQLCVAGQQGLAALACGDLPGRRLQHEHSMVALQSRALTVGAGQRIAVTFFACFDPDHPAASTSGDLSRIDALLARRPLPPVLIDPLPAAEHASLFVTAPGLPAEALDDAVLADRFGSARRHAEFDGATLLSFFADDGEHVALAAKERQLLRPHGHILRSGAAWQPDEAMLTSTTWSAGVFHSQLTQGHASHDRLLGCRRGYLPLFASHGLRLFVDDGSGWRLLDQPSAFAMTPDRCRWLYRHGTTVIEVRSFAALDRHELGLTVTIEGPPLRLLFSHQLGLSGDDGLVAGISRLEVSGSRLRLLPPDDSELARRYGGAGFVIDVDGPDGLEIGGDELLYPDRRSRGQNFLCLATPPLAHMALRYLGELVPTASPDLGPAAVTYREDLCAGFSVRQLADSDTATALARLEAWLPWLAHDATIHFLSPRGLEQFSGGGWGSRDVTQGPLEMLLALDRTAPIRDLLLRVFAMQNSDGDWPQWFMVHARDRHIRAADAHGDIVLWPLLALAEYLLASEDRSILAESLPYYVDSTEAPVPEPLAAHVDRAIALTERRLIAGTSLIAYGHGDWNDALQPASPELREQLCSAWTVTLHHRTLERLAAALRAIGEDVPASRWATRAAAIAGDFQQLLIADDVITGYLRFLPDGGREFLLHPRDQRTGIHYSLLPMIHAIIDDMLTPGQARDHLARIASRLSGPDGVRLFDRPLPYRGGPQQIFQRGESSTYFGREIGLMYTHAHLRYVEALARVGDGSGLLAAFDRINPIQLQERVPAAAPRQSNCYYSSSDADFADRYEAYAGYDRCLHGAVPLQGGWRIYSSGAGIALRLLVQHVIGLSRRGRQLVIDPVLPTAADGLTVALHLFGARLLVSFRIAKHGHGPVAVTINGHPLTMSALANPYRRPGVAVDFERFRDLLTADDNLLAIDLA